MRILIIFILVVNAFIFGYDRCLKYVPLVKKYHFYYFGISFPYWYSVGQIKVESSCIHKIWSKDGLGSYGLAQITIRIWKEELRKAGIPEVFTVKNNLKAQAYINYRSFNLIKRKLPECLKLWVMYQVYNGGYWVIREIKGAGECNHTKAYEYCINKGKRSKSACNINYKYSVKVYLYGLKYKVGNDSVDFW